MNTTHNEDGASADRPLGFWLRTVDALLTREFIAAFEAEGVTRRDWMLLNVLSGDVDAPGLADRLRRKGKRLRGLAERGWVEEGADGAWALTAEGRAARGRLSGIVDGLRERVAGAVSAEDYATMTASLAAIARELGADDAERAPFAFGPFGPGAFRPGAFGSGPFSHGRGRGGHHRHGFGGREFGGHRGHGAGHHPCEHPSGRRGEQAYERGFDAGFRSGRSTVDA